MPSLQVAGEQVPTKQRFDLQSACVKHVLESKHNLEKLALVMPLVASLATAQALPQSTSLSLPLFLPSVHDEGGGNGGGITDKDSTPNDSRPPFCAELIKDEYNDDCVTSIVAATAGTAPQTPATKLVLL
jgi:hypothetical protein